MVLSLSALPRAMMPTLRFYVNGYHCYMRLHSLPMHFTPIATAVQFLLRTLPSFTVCNAGLKRIAFPAPVEWHRYQRLWEAAASPRQSSRRLSASR